MEFQFVCKLKWTANGDLCICQCIWLLTKDKGFASTLRWAEACYAKQVMRREVVPCDQCVRGLCVGRLYGRKKWGRGQGKGGSLRELTHAVLAEKYQPLYISTLAFPHFILTLSNQISKYQFVTTQGPSAWCTHLLTPGTKCCHILHLPFLSHFLSLQPLQSWACTSIGLKQLASSLGSRVLLPCLRITQRC